MKKVLSLVIVAVMLLGIMPMGVMASGETEGGLIFEMDLTNYDGVDVSKITNSVEGNSSTITSGVESTAANYAVPELGVTENGTKYLTMRRTDGETDSSKAMVVQVTDEAFEALDDFTIETWVRRDGVSHDASRLFSMGNNVGTRYADAMDTGSGNIYYNGNGNAGTDAGKYDAYVAKTTYKAEEWTHLVFTREWVAGENGAGTWKHAVYVNGNQCGSTVEEEVTERTSQPGRLIIGGLSDASPRAAYWGDIRTFKVYSKVLSSNEAMKNYKDSLFDFATDNGLLFEMDLTNYDGVDVSKITNSVTGNSSTITSGVESTAANYAVPKLGIAKNGTKYLTMRRTDGETDSSKAMVVQVTDEAFSALDDFTIETWVRKDGGSLGASRLFSMGNSSQSAGYADAMDSGSGTIYYNGNGTAGGNVGTYDIQVAKTAYNAEEWTHFVFTREWVAGENGAGTWKHAVYINGNQYGSTVEEEVTERTSQPGRLIIGGLSETSPRAAYGGDIGTFKVYSKVLSSNEALGNYKDGLFDFYSAVTFSEFTTESESVTVTLSEQLTNLLQNQEYTVILAVYDGGSLVAASVDTTIDLTEVALEKGMVIKCFIWNNLESCVPLINSFDAYCL